MMDRQRKIKRSKRIEEEKKRPLKETQNNQAQSSKSISCGSNAFGPLD